MKIDNILFPQHDRDRLLTVNENYALPIVITDTRDFSPHDMHNLALMKTVVPMTRLKPGDLAFMTVVPDALRRRFARSQLKIPRIWEVRHVVSRWAWELYAMFQDGVLVKGVDHAVSLLEAAGIPNSEFGTPLVYAHGNPQAFYPNTASWLSAWCLRKSCLRGQTEPWIPILDCAETVFTGYENRGNITLDSAPDLYGLGKKFKRPFHYEEPTFQAACSLGLEELMAVPLAPDVSAKRGINEEDAYDYSPEPSPSSSSPIIHTKSKMIPKTTINGKGKVVLIDDL